MQSEQYKDIQTLLELKKARLKEYKETNRSDEMLDKVREQIATIREVLQLIRE
jgi:hypothetical protein